MTRLQSIDEIQTLIAEVRNKRKGFITNFYLDEFKHNIWIQKGDFFYETIGQTTFLVKKSATFCNLFYNSITVEALINDLNDFKAQHPDLVAMVDIVGRDAQCEPLITAMSEQGFTEATSLVRMNRITESMDYQSDDSIAIATAEELNEIHNLLHRFFDEKTEQIPYLDELQTYAKEGHILVCHENDRLAGFIIYEINATTLYLRYWFTHPDYRDKKVGSRLLRRFFEEGKNTKRHLLWVICTNENAIKRYRHYGFKSENMYDYVIQIN